MIQWTVKALQQEPLATADMKNYGDELGMEIRRLRDEKQAIQTKEASCQDLKARIDELMDVLNGLLSSLLNTMRSMYGYS